MCPVCKGSGTHIRKSVNHRRMKQDYRQIPSLKGILINFSKMPKARYQELRQKISWLGKKNNTLNYLLHLIKYNKEHKLRRDMTHSMLPDKLDWWGVLH